MTEKQMREKVALLKDGQIVEINTLCFRAIRIVDNSDDSPCLRCNVDSACKDEITDICNELDFPFQNKWYLNLVTDCDYERD